MSTSVQQFEAGALNAIAAAITENAATVEAWIATGEGSVQAGLVNLAKNLPTVKGAIGLVATPIEAAVTTAIEAYVASLIAKEPPAAIVAFVVSWLQAEAKRIGV
jgi:hypothetical protein